MTSPLRRRTLAVLAALATGLTLSSSAVAASGDREGKPARASVVGSAEFVLPYYKDDDIRSFTFDAHGAPYSRPLPAIPTGLPTDAQGTILISHYSAERNITYTSKGSVDCLVTGPRTATVTAVITEVSPGGWPPVGQRVGLSVYDGGRDKGRSADRVGFSWNGLNLRPEDDADPEDAPVGTCMAPAPFAPVTRGGYTVTHAELPPMPSTSD
ncbi:hypothetical protein [Streptomyces torulosus]|uniref:hypothetical protein n=1 Tax=Streptomyces torulosus TaxID=68276 RepID=UPI0006EBB70A|nr:hypothetical protein [Streptomyces torulosus]